MTFRWPRVTVGKLLRSFLSDSSYLYIHLFDMANPLWNFRQKKISGGAAALGEHPGSLPQPRPAPLPHRGGRVEALPIPLLTDGWGGSPSPNQSIDEKIGGDSLRARPEPAGGGVTPVWANTDRNQRILAISFLKPRCPVQLRTVPRLSQYIVWGGSQLVTPRGGVGNGMVLPHRCRGA